MQCYRYYHFLLDYLITDYGPIVMIDKYDTLCYGYGKRII